MRKPRPQGEATRQVNEDAILKVDLPALTVLAPAIWVSLWKSQISWGREELSHCVLSKFPTRRTHKHSNIVAVLFY